MNKRGSFAGIGKVYNFTLRQLFKNKSNLVTFGLLIVIALFIVPVSSLFAGGGDSASTAFYTDIMTMDELLGQDEVGFDSRYIVQYAYSIIVMVVALFSSTYIVRAIIEEKSSKLVETLLISINSEAMILGKILAVITFIFSMLIGVLVAFGASYFVTGFFADTSFVKDMFVGWGLTPELLNIGYDIIVIAIVSALLACISLSLIAALSGAGCSSMEDMESANMTATLVVLACYIITLVVTPFGSGPAIAMSLIPFVSSFAAPAYYIAGDIGFGLLAASWVVQIIVILLIHRLSGKVYDSLVMYKGKRLQMGQILKMAVSRKGEM